MSSLFRSATMELGCLAFPKDTCLDFIHELAKNQPLEYIDQNEDVAPHIRPYYQELKRSKIVGNSIEYLEKILLNLNLQHEVSYANIDKICENDSCL